VTACSHGPDIYTCTSRTGRHIFFKDKHNLLEGLKGVGERNDFPVWCKHVEPDNGDWRFEILALEYNWDKE